MKEVSNIRWTLKTILKYILEAIIIFLITICISFCLNKRSSQSYSDELFLVAAIIFCIGASSIKGVKSSAFTYFVKCLIISITIILLSIIIFYI